MKIRSRKDFVWLKLSGLDRIPPDIKKKEKVSSKLNDVKPSKRIIIDV